MNRLSVLTMVKQGQDVDSNIINQHLSISIQSVKDLWHGYRVCKYVTSGDCVPGSGLHERRLKERRNVL